MRRAGWKDAVVLLGLAVIATAKMWALVTPRIESRRYRAGDFTLAAEPYFYHMLKKGTIPLWDPTLGTGAPFLGTGAHTPAPVQTQIHLFYPLNLLGLALAERDYLIPHMALQIHNLLHYVLAGVLAYAYGRVLGAGRFAATVCGLAYMLSGFFLFHLDHWYMLDTAAWIPLVLACLVLADATERVCWGALGGLALGVACLAGFTQIFYYEALATVALALTLLGRRMRARRPVGRLAGVFALVPLVALGTAAVQLLPSWDLALTSHRAGLGYDFKAAGSLAPSHLLQLLLPGGLMPVGDWRGQASEYGVYAGLIPLIFAAYALGQRWDWRLGFHAALGLGALFFAFGSHYGVHRALFDVLPGVSLFRIPGRALFLVNLALAVLGGLGLDAFLNARRPPARFARALRRFTAAAMGVTALVLVAWVAGQGTSLENALGVLADQLVIQSLLLLLALGAVVWHSRGSMPQVVRATLLAVLILDLVFGWFSVSGDPRDPDSPPIGREREVAEVLLADPSPFRASLLGSVRPQLIYRYGWATVDDGSTFAPPAFLDLEALRESNLRIANLLNVKYLVRGSPWMPPAPGARPFRVALWPGAVRRLAVSGAPPVRQIELDSQLSFAIDLAQGEPVATLHVVDRDGTDQQFPIRAGIETAEWAVDRPFPPARHTRAPVARSWPVPDSGFEGHAFRATFLLPGQIHPTELLLERTGSAGVLVVERISLSGQDLPSPGTRLQPVTADLLQNLDALPRTFLVRRARQVPEDTLKEEMRELDPAEELLLTEPLPAGWPPPPRVVAGRLPPVRIAHYGPTRIRLEANVDEPVFLVLSDAYHRGWRAWDNGQPTTILRADHALRAVALRPGPHVVEFRYRQPEFWIGLAISLLTVVALGTAGLGAAVRRRRGRASGGAIGNGADRVL